MESGIPLAIGIRNPGFTDKGIQYVESKIQDCLAVPHIHGTNMFRIGALYFIPEVKSTKSLAGSCFGLHNLLQYFNTSI